MSTYVFFFFNDTATTEIYTLSLHDALPISPDDREVEPLKRKCRRKIQALREVLWKRFWRNGQIDRKSTRLNSSHSQISYAVFCLKKKKSHTKHKRFRYP